MPYQLGISSWRRKVDYVPPIWAIPGGAQISGSGCIVKPIFPAITDECGYCPTRGMGAKPSPSGEDFSLIVDAAARIQGVNGSRTQAKAWMVFSLDPSNPWILGPQAFGFSRRVLTYKAQA